MADLSDLEVRLSGGASQTDPNGSLGGAMSSTTAPSQAATALTTITGVVINWAAGNTEGTATVTYTSSTQSLQYTPPSGSIGLAVVVSSDGQYTIKGANDGGYIVVTVTAASLPTQSLSNTTTISNNLNVLFDDVAKAESLAGDSEYRCFYLTNTNGTDDIASIKIWVDENTSGQDTVQIALDPAGINGTATQNTQTVSGASWAANVSTVTVTGVTDVDVGDWVLVEGVTPSGYNGVYKVTAVATNSVSWAELSDPGAFSSGGTLTSEGSAPSGVNFNAASPVDEASALSIGTLTAGDYAAVWVHRLVPTETTTAVTENTFRLAIRVLV